jgi:hypothetical protein
MSELQNIRCGHIRLSEGSGDLGRRIGYAPPC